MTRSVSLAAAVLVWCTHARAEDGDNYLIGPTLGVRLGDTPGSRLIVGVEGGIGRGPERLNVGFQHRLDKMFYYVELDPWLYLGASFGAGVDEDQQVHGIIGLWEGLPLDEGPCSGWDVQTTIAGGYRYTGVHELYVTIKAGAMDGFICIE